MMSTKHTSGPWKLCHHLQCEEKDNACSCGYRGGIWGSDGECVICEMGTTEIEGELSLPRYKRNVELANAKLIAAAPELLWALQVIVSEVTGGCFPSIKDAQLVIKKATE